MIRLAVFYGGDSPERDISTITGVQTLKALSRDKRFETIPIFVRGQKFYSPKRAESIRTYLEGAPLDREVVFEGRDLYRKRRFRRVKTGKIDCALICLHGGWGEDGGVQGMLDGFGIPYTSPDVVASALGMDKGLSKLYFRSRGVNVMPYGTLCEGQTVRADAVALARTLGYPVILKPNAQGSSIGIGVAHNDEEMLEKLQTALCFDRCVIMERALSDFKEINCACFRGPDNKVCVSQLEQPVGWEEFLSFENKYLANGKLSGGGRIFPAPLDPETTAQIRADALKLYDGLDMKGIVRFDFLLSEGVYYVNEMNTVPGSLATYLYEDTGMTTGDIVEKLCQCALARHRVRKQADFASNVLTDYCNGSANACKVSGKIL